MDTVDESIYKLIQNAGLKHISPSIECRIIILSLNALYSFDKREKYILIYWKKEKANIGSLCFFWMLSNSN